MDHGRLSTQEARPHTDAADASASTARPRQPRIAVKVGNWHAGAHTNHVVGRACFALSILLISVQLVWQLPVALLSITAQKASNGLRDMKCMEWRIGKVQLRIPRLHMPSASHVLGLTGGSVVAMLLICALLAHAVTVRNAMFMAA